MKERHEVLLKIGGLSSEKNDSASRPSSGSFREISSYFGENVFSVRIMKKLVGRETFAAFSRWMAGGSTINAKQAEEIAAAMRKWASSRGATHYTHWFQPMTGLTAEKHNSFLSLGNSGKAVEEFSGSELIQGEPDASSLPSGGMRTTFEARGYTAWDPSSPAFIIESRLGKTLCIPSIFISYHGDALDKKLPLLRSEEALSKAVIRLLSHFGHRNLKKAFSVSGVEQEYFLIDKSYYRMRQDLLLLGKTLIGARSPREHQLEDQYFGPIKERVIDYMNEVAEEAYKLGIPIKTRHNEVAPHQYEFAPVFEDSNIAIDHNQLLMDIMKRTASRRGLACILHEKPFAGINGSGKHLNWSISDDKGNNLLNPGRTPQDNLQFLTVFMAVLRSVDRHRDLLRASVASAGNEYRLGGGEAPPSIISVYIGSQMSSILDAIESGRRAETGKLDIVNLGIGRLPRFNKDMTDRNRTSPFAFTGTKFEFRMPGAPQNISTSVMVLNTIVAESLDYIADRLEDCPRGKNFNASVMGVIAGVIKETARIKFEGNNYSKEWEKKARKLGLPNEHSTVKALLSLKSRKNIELFEKYGVLSRRELLSRYNIWLGVYITTLEIEANTLREMAASSVIPSGYEYQGRLANNLKTLSELINSSKLKIGKQAFEDEKSHLCEITSGIYHIRKDTKKMTKLLEDAGKLSPEKKAELYFNKLKPLMKRIRECADGLEEVLPDECWSLPKYREMLFVE